MNDLETRLREALDAAAHTVPDNAQPPGLTAPARLRSRRTFVIAIAAAAAVVIAIAVPFVTQRDKSAPTQPACPGGPTAAPQMRHDAPKAPEPLAVKIGRLPVGAPPRVPYTIANWESGGGYLQDGNTRVPLPAGMRTEVVGRLQCGWLVSRTRLPERETSETEFGILQPSGQFTRRGTSGPGAFRGSGLSVRLSPDGTKMAYTSRPATGGKQARLAVMDLASGNDLASTQVAGDVHLRGWNPSGIWLAFGSGPYRHAWWQPGSKPRDVTVPGMLYAYRTTDRMVAADIIGTRSCSRVVKLEPAGGLTKLLESCVTAPWSPEPALSPDGETLIQYDKARRVADGSAAPVPGEYAMGGRPSAWEDNEHVLFGGDKVVIRCNVKTLACERVYMSKDDKLSLTLVES